jgi:SecD/SecF fusion protein
MPTAYTGRVVTIIIVMVCALGVLFAPSGHINIRPGIDISGGVDLIYAIKPPPSFSGDASKLPQQIIEALRRRVDPNGVRNLIWRPLGDSEIEIQMPLSSDSAQAEQIRKDFTEAARRIDDTNVYSSQALAAVQPLQTLDDATLTKISKGSPLRLELVKKLADAAQRRATAIAQNDPEALNKADSDVADLTKQIDLTNLAADEVQSALEKSGDQKKTIADFQARDPGFVARNKALDQFAATFTEYQKIRNSLDDAASLKRLIQGSGFLEFHILVSDLNTSEAQAMLSRLGPDGAGPAIQAGDNMEWIQTDPAKPEEFAGNNSLRSWHDKEYVLCWNTPDKALTRAQTGWALESASGGADPNSGQNVVEFKFDVGGASAFGALTRANTHQPLGIVLDNVLISAPNIDEPITAGSGIIRGGKGGFTPAELDYLVRVLNAGSLPAQLTGEPISQRTVGPTLGHDNLMHGLIACGFGLIVVAVFMCSYYYLAGVVATIAVVMNVVIILGVLAAFGATFTLPSIAGIVLSIGTAVDANVLIFERLREEQHRGLPLRMALRNSYARAFSAIFDSNMTSVITSACLYAVGTEDVKGFGLTLLIGIAASLFTALFVTKTIYGILIDHYGLKTMSSLPLTFPKWDAMLKPNIDWMGMAWAFYVFSSIAILGGIVCFFVQLHNNKMLDIEFASGTSVEVLLSDPMSQQQLGDMITETNAAIPSPTIVAVAENQNQVNRDYEIITPNPDAKAVKDELLIALKGHLQLQLASTFDGNDRPFDQANGHQLIPVTGKAELPAFADSARRDYDGGAAILLSNLSPPLSADEIRDRIEQLKQQQASTSNVSDIVVVTSAGSGNTSQPADSAVVFINNPAIPYAKDPATWQEQVAKPAWSLVTDALSKQEDFRKVTSFNASVAGQAQQDASVALILSILFIMAYIWIRFGNLKYGTATVVALLHDTLFTIAALGYAHYIPANTIIGRFFQLEPFRINMTVVAGILTIMGYSMIDTIVVFDRIRENRGKYGHLDAQVINDAVNQTLSRTLLTCGTTTITVAFMYFIGGPGIHGFTFVLLIGILVGTYSSVAIAAPILLFHSDRERVSPAGGESGAGLLQAAHRDR